MLEFNSSNPNSLLDREKKFLLDGPHMGELSIDENTGPKFMDEPMDDRGCNIIFFGEIPH